MRDSSRVGLYWPGSGRIGLFVFFSKLFGDFSDEK